MKAGLIGCGFIGETLANAIDKEMRGYIELRVIYDLIRERAESLSGRLSVAPRIAQGLGDIVSDPEIELVLEAASQEVAKTIVPEALAAGKHVMIMSVGALADIRLYDKIRETSARTKTRVHIPSGAIGGLDWIKAASTVGLDKVTITSRKPPKALEGAPYVVRNNVDLESIKEPTQIYEGPASDASTSFPANVNVAVALSLAGIGSERTLVRVIADPTVQRNIHEISAEGAAGNITVRVENLPSPANPKTSWVAALSAVQKLKEIAESISLGT